MQVRVLALTDRTAEYAKNITGMLREEGMRAEVDLRNEKIGFKIREAQQERIPYMVILGDKEAENATVSVRSRKEGDKGAVKFSEFLSAIKTERDQKLY